MMKGKASLFLFSCLTMVGSAGATGLGVRAGTTGIGADVGFELVPTLSWRIGYSAFNLDRTVKETDVDYDGKLKLSNPSLLLDWQPLGVGFRVTGGMIVADTKFDPTARPKRGTFTINGVAYPADQIGSFGGTVKTGNRAAPYLGIGYGNVAGAGVNFYFDLGVAFQGSPKASLSATCGPALSAAQCTQLRRDVSAEQARLEGDISNFKYFPVASIGVTIGF
jgi:hypothetical protein